MTIHDWHSRKTLPISTNLEVYSSIAVFIEDSKYLINKNFCVAHWKNHWVHVEYFVFAQFTVWTINLKKEKLYWFRNKDESSAQHGPAKCDWISKRFLGWLQPLNNMPDKDLFIKIRTRTVVTLLLFWFEFLWISLYLDPIWITLYLILCAVITYLVMLLFFLSHWWPD